MFVWLPLAVTRTVLLPLIVAFDASAGGAPKQRRAEPEESCHPSFLHRCPENASGAPK